METRREKHSHVEKKYGKCGGSALLSRPRCIILHAPDDAMDWWNPQTEDSQFEDQAVVARQAGSKCTEDHVSQTEEEKDEVNLQENKRVLANGSGSSQG